MQVNHEMLTLVRGAQGWSQRDLADAAQISQAFLSRIERGTQGTSDQLLARFAEVLGCPEELLAAEAPVQALTVSCLHHRRRSSTLSAASKRRIEALTHLSRMTVTGLMADFDLEPDLELPRGRWYDAEPATAAAELRNLWKVAEGPIGHVVRLVEASGVVIVRRPLEAAGQDAVSSWPDGEIPIIVVRGGLSADRARFTIAHELGHLLMHQVPSDDQERAADAFASAFLAPAECIRGDLAGLTTAQFPRLLELKVKWGLSVAALIRRSHDLDIISDRQYREFQIRLNRLGWRQVEPGTLQAEHPSTVDRLIRARQDDGESVEELAALALMTPDAFQRHYLTATQPRRSLRLEAP